MVYFLQGTSGGPIKIGYCKDGRLHTRLKELQTAYPEELVVRSTIANASRSDEWTLHQEFSDARLHGEWFYPVPALASRANALVASEFAEAYQKGLQAGLAIAAEDHHWQKRYLNLRTAFDKHHCALRDAKARIVELEAQTE